MRGLPHNTDMAARRLALGVCAFALACAPAWPILVALWAAAALSLHLYDTALDPEEWVSVFEPTGCVRWGEPDHDQCCTRVHPSAKASTAASGQRMTQRHLPSANAACSLHRSGGVCARCTSCMRTHPPDLVPDTLRIHPLCSSRHAPRQPADPGRG